MKQIEWFNEHYYKVITDKGIKYLPSVTTILSILPKPYLSQWRGNLGNYEANILSAQAKERGSNIHQACNVIAKGGVVLPGYNNELNSEFIEIEKYRTFMYAYSQEEYLQVYRFVKLMDILQPDVIESESKVYNLNVGYAGTLDLLMNIQAGKYKINGTKPIDIPLGVYLCDIKSGKTIPDETWMQIAAYSKAYKLARPDVNICGGMIIHTNSTTKLSIEGLAVKIKSAEELEEDYNNFLKVFEVWKVNPTVSAPKIFELPEIIQWTKQINSTTYSTMEE